MSWFSVLLHKWKSVPYAFKVSGRLSGARELTGHMGGQSQFCGSGAEIQPAILRLSMPVIDGEMPVSKWEEREARRHPKIHEDTQAE